MNLANIFRPTSSRTKFPLAVIALIVVVAFILWRGSKARCWQLTGEVTCRVETSQPVVALSFDDGPTDDGVTTALAELEKRHLHATFFLIGAQMENHPGQAERLLKAGNELGNHSYSHKWMMGKSQTHYETEIAKTDALLRKAGATPSLFRPPFGKRLFGLPWAVQKAGYRMITWDVEGDLDHHPDPRDYANALLSQVKPGSIILMHPMNRVNAPERAAIPLVLDGLTAKGLRIVTVGELLKLKVAN